MNILLNKITQFISKFDIKSTGNTDSNIIDTNDRKKHSNDLLRLVLRVVIVVIGLYVFIRLIVDNFKLGQSDIILLGIISVLVICYFLIRINLSRLSAVITVAVSFIGTTIIAFYDQGIRDQSLVTYTVIIVFATLLLGKTATIIVTFLSILTIWLMLYFEDLGIVVYRFQELWNVGRDLTVIFILTSALSLFYDKVINRYIKEINHSRLQFKDINNKLIENSHQMKKINDELNLAKKKAEESDHLKTAFLANLSHEIRTPMNGIIGFSELAVSIDVTEDQRLKYNSIIANSCKQLLGVVNSIIDISKIESGIIEINYEAFNLNHLLNDIYNLNSLSASNRGLEFELLVGFEDKDSMISTDSVKLRQILANLIGNSLKFTTKGHIKFGYTKEGQMLEFFVIDTGIGINKERHKDIFERFTQEHADISRKYGGTGLGLSISQAYIREMGGTISLSSEPGNGTHIRFNIPYVNAETTSKSQPEYHDLKTSKSRILVVEDIEINEMLIEGFLNKYQFEIVVARTGEEALEIFNRQADFVLIFLDIKLPDIDGYEVSSRIRKKSKTVPIIAQTAYAFSSDRELALAAGCNDLITKPITQAAIDDVIQKYLTN